MIMVTVALEVLTLDGGPSAAAILIKHDKSGGGGGGDTCFHGALQAAHNT